MTFVLGMRCADGIGLFADTLESGGAVKRYRQKVHAENIITGWGVAWGVAGNAHVADKFSEKLRMVLGHDDYDRHKTELVIEQCLKWMRKQYSGPEEDIELILGMFGTPKRQPQSKAIHLGVPEAHLYRADSLTACLAPVMDYSIAGMDVTLAAFLLDNMRNPFLRIDEAVRLGVVATAVMKKYASGVGGDTNGFVYRIDSGTWTPLLEREIAVIDTNLPVIAIEQHTAAFWLNHPKARNNEELLASEMALRNAMGQKSKRLTARKSKREP